MNVIQLACFLEAAKEGSFTRAAAKLYLSQPTFSRHIQALEEEVHAPLFRRGNNTVRLTAIGTELLPMLENLYRTHCETESLVERTVSDRTNSLRIGVMESLALDGKLRHAIGELRREIPQVKIQFYKLDFRTAYSELVEGNVDLLLSLDNVVPRSEQLSSIVLRREKMCLAVPASHPNAVMTAVDHKEIEYFFPDLEFCLIDAEEFETPVQSELKTAMPVYNDSEVTKLSGSMANLGSLALAVQAGIGCTCVNESSLLGSDPGVRLIPLIRRRSSPDAPSDIGLALYWINKSHSHAVQVLLSHIKK